MILRSFVRAALARLMSFLYSESRMERLICVILIRRIGLEQPSCELKLRIKVSPPGGGVQK